MSVKKWVSLGIVYVIIVFAGYSVITGNNPLASGEMEHDEHSDEENGHEEHEGDEASEEETTEHDDHNTESNQEEDEDMDHKHEHEHEHGHEIDSEVKTDVSYDNEELVISLEDDTGAAPEFAVEHEKEMHFILISNDLEDYYHLHPEKEEEGRFRVNQALADGTYQAFVDIVPENKAYTPAPNPLQIGTEETANAHLHADNEWTKEINGKTVTLEEIEATAGEEVPLVFDMQGEQPETHLGALGHVVIVDEEVEEYIHVHPASDDSTTFNAHFTNPGMYKVWAEFKFDGEIHVYPFILEVKE